MEKEDQFQLKKEDGALFYNFKIKNNNKPITTEIKSRDKKIKDMYIDINTEIDNFYLSANNNLTEKNIQFYRYWIKYLTPFLNKPKKIKLKKKKNFSLNSKIYFGSFLDENYYYGNAETSNKYDKIKKIISKSKNFSFIKNPKTVNFSKLPFELYLSKDDSSDLRKLVSIKNIQNYKHTQRNKEKFCNNNIFHTNVDSDKNEEFKNKTFQDKYKNIITNNNDKTNENKNNHFSPKLLLKKINKDNSFLETAKSLKTYYNSSKFLISKNSNDFNDKNISNNKILQNQKNNSYSNISEVHNIYPKLSMPNRSYSNLNNSFYDRTFYITQKKFFLNNLNESLDKIIKCKTPKKEINNLSEIINKKCKKKIDKIDKIIRKQNNCIPNKNLIINLLSNNKDQNQNLSNTYYTNLKNKVRLLSVVDNLKNITQNAPMNLMEHLEKDYQIKSKKMIKNDLFTKKINNIYKSFTEGKLINKKISSRNIYINKLASKNILDLVNLKSKYQKFDLLIKKIKEENNKTRNNKIA